MPTSRGWSLHTSLSPHTHTNTYTHTYTHIHTHTHPHIRTHTHTHTNRETFLTLSCFYGRLEGRFSRDRPRFTDTLDAIKFLCKDLWTLVFRKQIDNLKTNHRVCIYVCVPPPFFLPGCGGLVRGEGKGAGRQAGMN